MAAIATRSLGGSAGNRSTRRDQMKDEIQLPPIPIKWKDPALAGLALTHPSWANEKKTDPLANERLEFLGDAVLDLLVGERLYRGRPDWGPGLLSDERSRRVCRATVASKARAANIGKYIRLGRGAEMQGLRSSDRVIGDALEALVGAAYLDQGIPGAMIVCTWAGLMEGK